MDFLSYECVAVLKQNAFMEAVILLQLKQFEINTSKVVCGNSFMQVSVMFYL